MRNALILTFALLAAAVSMEIAGYAYYEATPPLPAVYLRGE
jgi:hypothetical protein